MSLMLTIIILSILFSQHCDAQTTCTSSSCTPSNPGATTYTCTDTVDTCNINCLTNCNNLIVHSAATTTTITCHNTNVCNNLQLICGYNNSKKSMTQCLLNCENTNACNNVNVQCNGNIANCGIGPGNGQNSAAIDGDLTCNLSDQSNTCSLNCGNTGSFCDTSAELSLTCAADNIATCLCNFPCPGHVVQTTLTHKPTTATSQPTTNPTKNPTKNTITSHPTINPTINPTKTPVVIATNIPTNNPTYTPTLFPNTNPIQHTLYPSNTPTNKPSNFPTIDPINEQQNDQKTTPLLTENENAKTDSNAQIDKLQKQLAITITILVIISVIIIILVSIYCFKIYQKKKQRQAENTQEGVIITDLEMERIKSNSSIVPSVQNDNESIYENESMYEMNKKQGFYCRAMYDYDDNEDINEEQLSFKEGEIFYILKTTESGWFYGINEHGLDGWIPSNYVEVFNEEQEKELKEERTPKTDNGESYIDLLTESMDKTYNNFKDNNLVYGNIDKYVNVNLPPKIPDVNVETDGESDMSSDISVDNQTVGNISNIETASV
eukprot:199469_1